MGRWQGELWKLANQKTTTKQATKTSQKTTRARHGGWNRAFNTYTAAYSNATKNRCSQAHNCSDDAKDCDCIKKGHDCLQTVAFLNYKIHKNTQKLMLEVYNSSTQQNPSFMWDMFHEKDNDYNLRSKNLLMLPQTKTTTCGNDSLSFRGSISWNSLLNDITTATSVCFFKSYIKQRNGESCRCRICELDIVSIT